MRDVFTPPEQFLVCRWPDPLVESHGFPVNSIYTETVLLPILGPSATLCLRRLGAWAALSPDGLPVNTSQLAGDLGLGAGLGRNAPISRTLNRLCQFYLAQWVNYELAVRTAVAPLSERHLRRLSPPRARGSPDPLEPNGQEGPHPPAGDCRTLRRAARDDRFNPARSGAVTAQPTPISDHTVAWVAAGLLRPASSFGVALPASYSETVARDGLQRCPQLAVSQLGRGAVIHTAPETADQLPIVLGYADAAGQWYRDGRRHHDTPQVEGVAAHQRMGVGL